MQRQLIAFWTSQDAAAVGELTVEDRLGERVLQQLLNRPLERPRSVQWVEPLARHQLFRLVVEGQRQLLRRAALARGAAGCRRS